MSCTFYQNDTLHSLSEKEQQKHLESCPLCSERKAFEDQIMQEAGQLHRLKPDNALWDKIENTLQQDQNRKRSGIFAIPSSPKTWLSAAAIVIAIFSVSIFYFFSGGSEKILSDGALFKVELSEQNYIDAITDLENEAKPKMAQLDTDLMLLYRDKLETIDRQIKSCREAIQSNPGNAHIRRYMLAALQDKKDTLKEILSI